MLKMFQKLREEYQPKIPSELKDLKKLAFIEEKHSLSSKDAQALKELFPKTSDQPLLKCKKSETQDAKPIRVGVVFSGGQAPGGHNVITGLFDALKTLHPQCSLFGFLNGPSGLIEGNAQELTQDILRPYRNQGGFDLLGSGRTKIETEEQLQSTLSVIEKYKLDGIVIIGGDDSNTNAAVLAEYFLKKGNPTCVIGVPKTIDGDLQNACVRIPFGFDTASKTYAELIGNIARDALSSKKYYHFIKLMGRTASHLTLECALLTHPNIALISEECSEKKMSLKQLVQEISDQICLRAQHGKNYGIVLVPEGLIEFLSDPETLKMLPESIQKQLLSERDAHGNIPLSSIETEVLLANLVKQELASRKEKGTYKGKFASFHHFLGYEGRSAFPTNFDAQYCTALGFVSALLLMQGHTGYMAAITNLTSQVEHWQAAAVPLIQLMHLEKRGEKKKPVIAKALVDLKGAPFKQFDKQRKSWVLDDAYQFPGPIQFFGDPLLTDSPPYSLTL
jgi:pyrophosphate--fructose-6-phosphate 1-phosphotransferase